MLFTRASEAADVIAGRRPGPIGAGVVLGSGLGGLVDRLSDPMALSYAELPHFPMPTVSGHAGQLVLGDVGGMRVAMFQGRFHYYEGHELDCVTFPVRVLHQLGVPRLILTAATGGIREDLGPGSIACLADHLNLLGVSPLRGKNDDRLGPRFLDLSEVYSARLRALAMEEAARLGLPLSEAVYACVPGPNYETPAEVRMLRTMGADVVGMSTVPEAIVARHGGLEVLGLAVVSNRAAGIGPGQISHAEVLGTGLAVGGKLADLVEAVLRRMASEPGRSARAAPGSTA